jgi:hypothetical protein
MKVNSAVVIPPVWGGSASDNSHVDHLRMLLHAGTCANDARDGGRNAPLARAVRRTSRRPDTDMCILVAAGATMTMTMWCET